MMYSIVAERKISGTNLGLTFNIGDLDFLRTFAMYVDGGNICVYDFFARL